MSNSRRFRRAQASPALRAANQGLQFQQLEIAAPPPEPVAEPAAPPLARRRRWRGPEAQCGTTGGYAAHRRLHETPCPPCLEARRVYLAAWRAANPRSRDRDSQQSAAYHAAVRRLREMFPAEWALLYGDERRRAGLPD